MTGIYFPRDEASGIMDFEREWIKLLRGETSVADGGNEADGTEQA